MDDSGTVYLNVGGNLYTTTQAVLTRDNDSAIGKMFLGDPSKWTIDRNGNVFIDRDGSLFRYILNFLRDDQLIVPTKFAEFDLLLQEARVYEMKKLEEAILRLMSCRKIIVLLREGNFRSPINLELQVQTKDKISKQLTEKFKDALLQNFSVYKDLVWTTYYQQGAAVEIKTFLTELGFVVSEKQGTLLTYVKDL
ncbi:putative BTB/POZ domain-containing protein KCTD6-like isoform X2 [Apostichopus japonicus]|uniref:Putative BTB/POZ domain-containing protein KCTD6-like isoform X2 n=1 Tax=Stichopus japonicus TaxID=307972 RepID=A0A2G8JZE0_STIJA|nr:putative BTB/POZ domain-containing protein KCTD6-like isoform X2 [Apostichopus japonicus]